MADTLFKEVHYSLGGLINNIGLPDIQRPFVWTMGYDEFLTTCRPLIARVIRAGYAKLTGDVA